MTLPATASSGLPVTYTVSGHALLVGNQMTITGAGAITITAKQAGDANFNAATTVTQILTVNQATLTVTANDATWNAHVAGQSLAGFSITGFVNGDTQTSLFGTEAALLTSTVNQNDPLVGTYTIVISKGTLATLTNYKLKFVNGNLTVH
jgi:hypothetical protein